MNKRGLDVFGAVLGLLLTLPLLIVLAIAIKLDSPGPIFFAQPRIGRHGRRFRMYKFRSMFVDSDRGAPVTTGADARVTPVGRVIRPWRIDEVPQLVNVLIGDMSLVGPRPEDPAIVERYSAEQRAVLNVRPGMTGPTQLTSLDESARLPADGATDYYVEHVLPRKLQTDLEYVRTQTLVGDLHILFKTPLCLARFGLARPGSGQVLKFARLVTDCVLVGVATYAAYLVRFDGDIPVHESHILLWGLPFELAAYAGVFLYFGTFRSIWRYTGVHDFWQIVIACAVAGSVNAAGMHMMRWPYPRSILLLTPVFAVLFLGGLRLTWRTVSTAAVRRASIVAGRRAVIVGAGRIGASIAREIRSTPGLAYDVIGFVDDAPHLRRATLQNLPVLGTTADLVRLTHEHRLHEAIIAIPRPTLSQLRKIQQACRQAGLVFKTLPSVGQLVSGDGQVRYLRNVDVGELLPREARALESDTISKFLAGKRVMVTGAGGSIGSELCRQIIQLGAGSLLMVERAENALFTIYGELQAVGARTKLAAALADVKHVHRMKDLLADFRPQVIFHTAAYKHVPMLEAHPTEAVLNNVIGTARLAKLAASHGVEDFVFISTDKAVRPSNLMGATKRICELYLMALERGKADHLDRDTAPRYRIVRFGNVLGSAGSAVPLFQRQIENGTPLTITDPEVSRFFMTIKEAVGLVLESTTLDTQGGIAVLDMGQPVKITALADDLVTALGLPGSAVPRETIGLRPGEKLHEELWDEADEVLTYDHPRIAVVRPRHSCLKDMEMHVAQLEQLAVDGLVVPLLANVRELIPSYTGPQNGNCPGVLRFEPQPRKPLATAPANGAAAKAHMDLRRVEGA